MDIGIGNNTHPYSEVIHSNTIKWLDRARQVSFILPGRTPAGGQASREEHLSRGSGLCPRLIRRGPKLPPARVADHHMPGRCTV